MYNQNLCMARKNMGAGINMQCSYKRKFGEYCGFHKNKRIRIDETLPLNYKNYLNNISNEPKKKLVLKAKNNIKILNSNSTKLINISDYSRGAHLKCLVKDLKYSLSYYKLSTTGKKNELLERLSNYFNMILIYEPYINHIITIQRAYRNYLTRKITKLRGPGYFDRSLCVNDYDFFTCEDKNEIENKYFISYMDDKKFIYCFDVRSLTKLMENAGDKLPINPYNLCEFPFKVISSVNYIIDELQRHKKFEGFEEIAMTAEQSHRDKIIQVFHKLDELDNHTKSEWFTKLTLRKLNKFYHSLIDIWTYRAGLSDDLRNTIVPDGPLFKLNQTQLAMIKDRKKVQNIIIGTMDRLISSAVNRSDRILGSLYVLTALSEVSKGCAESNQFLIQ